MIVLPSGLVDPISAPPLVPAERPIDLEHLSHMTLGDRKLERDVLALFDRQTAMLIERMRGAPAGVVAAVAHTLKGSARGIGAWPLARAAEQVEHAASGQCAVPGEAMAALMRAHDEVRAVIADLLRGHSAGD
jgi:HPt (histidine-containing phosphotransfer) domain-containing protein